MESFRVEDKVETLNLKGIFLPFISTSHLIPVVDMARLFAMHGVDVTIITTPANAAVFQSSIDRDCSNGRSIRTHVVKFPQVPGLPEGVESINASTPRDTLPKLMEGLFILKEKFQQLFHDMQPDFIVTDMFYPWSVDVAAELGIPRLIYVGSCYFTHCAMDSVERFEPHTKVGSDSESFVLPELPHEVEMTRLQLPDWIRVPNSYTYFEKVMKESERKSYGSVFKSFYEFEGDYEEHYKRVMGIKSWSVGPVSLWVNQDDFDKASRGNAKEKGKEEEGLVAWLDSKKEGSVVYVSFGSMNKFPTTQLVEIAHALEDSGHDFIWVVRKIDDDDGCRGFMEEFERRVKASNKGYLIWGWAPQLVILEHPATRAVVTHCGMNTVFESVIAGLPMVTWPIFAEQFYNEKLLVDVLRIGVSVGAKECRGFVEFCSEVVKREDIGKAIALLMGGGEESVEMRRRVQGLSDAAKKALLMGGGEESVEMRRRVQGLSDAAKKAIQVGGSSYNNLKRSTKWRISGLGRCTICQFGLLNIGLIIYLVP